MFAQVPIAVIGIMLFSSANGGRHAVCGNEDEIDVCKPRHECKDAVVGTCQSFWCCKSETYSENIPPAGDCICVSDLKYCEMVPFPYQHRGGDCVCCDCTEQCAPLQSYNSNITMCPNFERPIGNCNNNQNKYCCPSDESDDLCKCLEVCPKAWKLIGSCGKCCLNEAEVNSEAFTKPRTLELLCGIYITHLLTSYLIK